MFIKSYKFIIFLLYEFLVIKDKNTELFIPERISDLSFCAAYCNLLSTNRLYGLYSTNTFVDPKYKRLMNFWLFYVLWYLFFSLFLTFNKIDLMQPYETNIKNIVGYFFAAYGLALLANLLSVWVTYDSRTDKEDLKDGISKNNLHMDVVSRVQTKNTVKTAILLVINLMLTTLLYYSACGYSAYWIKYKGIMEVGLPIMLGVDLFTFDLILSFFMAMIYKCKCNCLFKILNIFKFTRCL